MPRAAKKSKKPSPIQMQHYGFEITAWEPSYSLSVNHDRRLERLYNEYAGIEISGACILPTKLKGRTARITIMGDRDHTKSVSLENDPSWRPRSIGGLEFRPSGGEFYMMVPLDHLLFLFSAIERGMFRYILLWGPEMVRSRSLCKSVQLLKEVNPDEY